MMAELEALRAAWNDAWLRKDAFALDEMMTDDFVYIAANGALTDRQALLDLISSPAYRLYEGTRTEVAVSIIGPQAAAIVHRWIGSGTFQGRPFRDDQRCTMVCVLRGDSWQILLEHCSAIAEAPRPRATVALTAHD
jgi:ketosteroid isomerase-like protein